MEISNTEKTNIQNIISERDTENKIIIIINSNIDEERGGKGGKTPPNNNTIFRPNRKSVARFINSGRANF